MKQLIITAPFPVLERLRKRSGFGKYFSPIKEIPGQTQFCSIKLQTESQTVDICNFLAREETRDILTLFWLKYRMLCGSGANT